MYIRPTYSYLYSYSTDKEKEEKSQNPSKILKCNFHPHLMLQSEFSDKLLIFPREIRSGTSPHFIVHVSSSSPSAESLRRQQRLWVAAPQPAGRKQSTRPYATRRPHKHRARQRLTPPRRPEPDAGLRQRKKPADAPPPEKRRFHASVIPE